MHISPHMSTHTAIHRLRRGAQTLRTLMPHVDVQSFPTGMFRLRGTYQCTYPCIRLSAFSIHVRARVDAHIDVFTLQSTRMSTIVSLHMPAHMSTRMSTRMSTHICMPSGAWTTQLSRKSRPVERRSTSQQPCGTGQSPSRIKKLKMQAGSGCQLYLKRASEKRFPSTKPPLGPSKGSLGVP